MRGNGAVHKQHQYRRDTNHLVDTQRVSQHDIDKHTETYEEGRCIYKMTEWGNSAYRFQL